MNFLLKIISFLKEVRLEGKKIDWPTRKQTLNYTIIVVAVSVAVAAFLGGMDFAFSEIIRKFII